MINAVIIDDEARNRKTLELLLHENFAELNIAGQAKDVKSGLELIEKCNPKIVFLDIEMPDGTGFDLLRKIRKYDFEIIFTTAHDEYALEAFKFSAIGYLLKPISEKELRVSVQKAMHLLTNAQDNREEHLKALMENFENASGKMRKIVLPEVDGFRVLALDEILFFEGEGNYTHLYLTDKRSFLSSHNLGWFEKTLISQNFFRISKSHFINLDHVTRYLHKQGGTVLMSDTTSLTVSDNKKEELRNRFL